ncbi:MAG: glucose-1-phosphate adenylyltransferase [Dehalococcoidia bacterium]|nr:glucose-1-phosphate adenylyltransferase [Dehalococcoidia bacterium]
MNRVLALILAGGMGNRLSILAEERAKPAVMFAGKYRIIDFTLSNCVNSGIDRVGVLTQYRPMSLNQHIGLGKPWDLDRERGGVSILQPYVGRKASDWYRGTADAVYQNLNFVEETSCDQVLILAGDHVYKMNYNDIVSFHQMKKADVTIGIINVPIEEASRFGILSLDNQDTVVKWEEKPARPTGTLASMGIYVFQKQALIDILTEDAAKRSSHDFGNDIIPAMVERHKVYGFRFTDYWRDIGTVSSYWQASMELLAEPQMIDMRDQNFLIRTRSKEMPPAKISNKGNVHESLISHGCVIKGEVRHSILSPGVTVEEGAKVEDSVIFDDTYISSGVVINKSIVDKEVVVGAGAIIGFGNDMTPNADEPDNLASGVTLVGKRAKIPAFAKIGRNCRIDPSVREQDFKGQLTILSGKTVARVEGTRAYA